MRELDVVLSGWLAHEYEGAPAGQKTAFERLLSLSDPELASYLLAGSKPLDDDIAGIVNAIRNHAQR